jgi:hypothetical protein
LFDDVIDVSNINKKETPEDKIELLRNVADIYKLIVKEQHSADTHNHCHGAHYTLDKLIFRALLIAEPPNFITNLAYVFVHSVSFKSSSTKTSYSHLKAKSSLNSNRSPSTSSNLHIFIIISTPTLIKTIT